ncbi:MAG: methyltransferase domain-containing protein [Defluviitaleaceae bacterium]|nr:methyltransferase domain-containing protein [Defluviitaleaceae bacterium]
MLKMIFSLLVCPICKSNLHWDVYNEDYKRIINAKALCVECKNTYHISDEIGYFLCEKELIEDSWQYEKNVLDELSENEIQQLLKAPISTLNDVDLYYLGQIKRQQGKHNTYNKLKVIERQKRYSTKYLKVMQGLFETMQNLISNKSILLDIATGTGTLLRWLEKANFDLVICSDISYYIMKELKKDLITRNTYEKASLLVMNAEKMPFLPKSIPFITSYLGLGHISDNKSFLNEVKRVLIEDFYSIEIFYPENNDSNHKYITQNCMEENLFERLIFDIANKNDLLYTSIKKEYVQLDAVKSGIIINKTSHKLPIEATEVTLNLLNIKNQQH